MKCIMQSSLQEHVCFKQGEISVSGSVPSTLYKVEALHCACTDSIAAWVQWLYFEPLHKSPSLKGNCGFCSAISSVVIFWFSALTWSAPCPDSSLRTLDSKCKRTPKFSLRERGSEHPMCQRGSAPRQAHLILGQLFSNFFTPHLAVLFTA